MGDRAPRGISEGEAGSDGTDAELASAEEELDLTLAAEQQGALNPPI